MRVPFILSRLDVYQIKVIGKPLTPNAFQPFTLIWYFRVDHFATNADSDNPSVNFYTFNIILVALIIIGIGIYVFYNIQRKSAEKLKKSKKNDNQSVY